MLANYPHKRSLYKWALPYFPQCLLRSKIPLSISAPRPFSASVPLPCDRRAPQTATGRRRATATGRRRAPQTATGRRRAPQTATGRRRAPQTATGRRRAPRRPQDAGERPRRPQDAGERPILSKIPTSSWTRLEGVEPPETPFFYLIHLGRAPPRAYARIMRPARAILAS